MKKVDEGFRGFERLFQKEATMLLKSGWLVRKLSSLKVLGEGGDFVLDRVIIGP